MEKPRVCKTIDEIAVGDRIERPYQISDADTEMFATLCGDFNPVHFDEQYAAATLFHRRIAHGMLSLAKFSGIFGMDLPGLGTLWETQEVRFVKPVYLNEPYLAVAAVTAKDRRRVQFDTWVQDEKGIVVLSGRATVIPITDPTRRKLGPQLQTLLDIPA